MVFKTKAEKAFIGKIKQFDKLIIYGAGNAGKYTLDWLKMVKLDNKILCFAVTSSENSKTEIDSIPVKEIGALSDYTRNTLVVIAALGNAQNAMRDNSIRLGFAEIFCITNDIYLSFARHVKKKSQRNLYICLTYYHVLISLTKIITEKQDADMLLAMELNGKHDLAYRMLKSGYIKNVYYCNPANTVNFHITSRIIRRFIDYRKIIETFEIEVGIDLKRYKDVYVYSDNNIIGQYLCAAKCKHHYVEDGLNGFRMLPVVLPDLMEYWKSKRFKFDMFFNLEFQPYGQSKFCKTIEVNSKDDLPIPRVNSNKVIEYPRIELFSKLTKEEREKIYSIFLGEKTFCFNRNEKSILILTDPLNEYFVGTKQKNGDVHKKIIEDVKNDFDKIYIKAHPRDGFPYHEIPGIEVIDKEMPIEVFNLIEEVLFDKAITVMSTAINGIEFVSEKETLGIEYLSSFMDKT